MEAEISSANHQTAVHHRIFLAVVPVLLISVGYVDPGKWAAVVEGGARFGFDLVALMLVFNFAAILCQYLSAHIGVVTGRDLAQICSDEYDKCTCLFLGIQAELSLIALDLTMVLGIAHGLNLLFGVDLFTCVFLTAFEAVLFPLFATLLENCKAKFLCICMASFILFSCILGVLISQPEIPLSMNAMLTRLSGESVFSLMSLLGASIMPHNFYLHSSIVQQHQGPANLSKSALCHDQFFAILSVFSGIYLVNYVLMNSAANVFYSTGLVLLTFQDAMSIMEQVFRSPIAPLSFLLVLFFSNQIIALTWNLCGQVVLHDFFRLELPGWLHRVTVRIIAVLPALFCVWTSGAEGLYQLLVFTQVMVALLLPSSVIPLFRVASSRPIMGVYKISQSLEFVALVTFIGMLGLKVVFVVEMVFGNCDWVGNLRWNMGISTSIPYVILFVTACVSFCLMLWLAATPLKCASSQLDTQTWNWDIQRAGLELFTQEEENALIKTKYHGEDPFQKQESLLGVEKSLESPSDDLDLPETIMESDQELHLTTIDEKFCNITNPSPTICHPEESASMVESVSVSTKLNDATDGRLLDSRTVKIEPMDPVEETVGVEGDVQTEKDDDEGDTWEPEESSKGVPGSSPSLTSEGPGSFRSLSGKSDEGGNGAGSLSRLAGLGRAARRQLAAVLDEFWRQLYDLHGRTTHEARVKKLDVLLGADLKLASSLKVETTGKELTGYFQSVGGKGSDSLVNSTIYDSPKQQRVQGSIESSYGVPRGSTSLWSNHMQLLDAYVQNSSRNILDSGERRYSSLRVPPSSEGWDHQPATVHGYQISSYIDRLSKDRKSDCMNSQMETLSQKSPPLGPINYRDSLTFALGQKVHNGISPLHPPGFHNLPVSRSSQLQTERSYSNAISFGPDDNVGISSNTKKYHSLPDISGFSVPHRDLYMPDRSAQWDSPIGFGSSVGRTSYEASLYANTGSRVGAPLQFDEHTPSKSYTEAVPLQLRSTLDARSLWSRQPFEQFGVADKSQTVGSDGVGSSSSSITGEITSVVDSEVKLLQSFRYCIIKLLKLEGSDWLFRQNDGADEDLIDRVAARERFLYEAESREMNQGVHTGEHQYVIADRKFGSALKNDEAGFTNFLVSSVPNCGEGCIWKPDLIISFGVWCIHRILDLSLMESRPELWGKYTYVLNRLQGIIDLAFSKPRSQMTPCFCLQIPAAHQQRLSPPVSNGMLPPAAKPAKGKCTTAATLLDIVKDVEIAISCRKGRTGTAAGDVAFPKGKENLASVLKRYKHRLSNKPVGTTHKVPGSRRVPTTAPYCS